jgi:hypothetical protein
MTFSDVPIAFAIARAIATFVSPVGNSAQIS